MMINLWQSMTIWFSIYIYIYIYICVCVCVCVCVCALSKHRGIWRTHMNYLQIIRAYFCCYSSWEPFEKVSLIDWFINWLIQWVSNWLILRHINPFTVILWLLVKESRSLYVHVYILCIIFKRFLHTVIWFQVFLSSPWLTHGIVATVLGCNVVKMSSNFISAFTFTFRLTLLELSYLQAIEWIVPLIKMLLASNNPRRLIWH